jgi:UDP-arabinose 4-epimerase
VQEGACLSNKILVTGGAGYIGSHACKALAGAGLTPIVFDNLSRGFEWAVKWGPFEHGDILDQARVEDVIRRHRPIAVMHFAALADVGESVADPAAYYRGNVLGSLTLLEAMRAMGVGRMVFSSSCTTYGVQSRDPIGEDTPQAPVNPYGATKLTVEQALRHYAAAYGLSAVALRHFNAAGADPDGEIGEAHDPETHLIPLVLEAAAGGPTLTVFGDDYETPDGTCVRDYVHVSDLAEAHVLACQSMDLATGFRAYNLGAGRGFSNMEIIAAARRRTGSDIPIRVGPRRQGDPPILLANPSKAKRELGWTPHLSGLEDIIDTAWRWRSSRSRATLTAS